MFRTFVVVAEILVLIFVLRTPFVQYFLSDMQSSVSNWFTELSQMADQQALNELKRTVDSSFSAMRPAQRRYLDEVMSSRASLNHFYQLYCLDGDKNPFIYGASLRVFCSRIKESNLLDEHRNIQV